MPPPPPSPEWEAYKASAEQLGSAAGRALVASESAYYGRLRPLLLEGCGAVCDHSLHRPGPDLGFWLSPVVAPVNCAGLLGNRQLTESAHLWPPPSTVPVTFEMDFRAVGVAIVEKYMTPYNRSGHTAAPTPKRCRWWEPEAVENLKGLLRGMNDQPLWWKGFDRYVGYDFDDLNTTWRFVQDLHEFKSDIEDTARHWLVLGSENPWIEAALLETGVATKVTTLEYTELARCPSLHPDIHPVTPSQFSADYPGGERFDGFVQYSSVEHSGLGAYGDEINPWADRQTIAQLWCRGVEGAWFIMGPGPPGPGGSTWENSRYPDKIYFNAGRDYGVGSMQRLMLNWQLVRPAKTLWNVHLFRRLEPSGDVGSSGT